MHYTYTAQERDEFLRESNAIEGVYDEECLEDAIAAWKFLEGAGDMSEANVLEVHRILMQRRAAWDESTASILGKEYIGKYRDGTVYVGGKPAMDAADIKDQMPMWVGAMNMECEEDQEGWAKDLHVLYEYIHPFWDGNGRTGRIFMNWWRIRNELPLLIIHEGFEQAEYYKWFQKSP